MVHRSALTKALSELPHETGCTNCEHYREIGKRCEHFGAEVPAEHYRVNDCPVWSLDPIPF